MKKHNTDTKKCPYCGWVFNPLNEDIEMIDEQIESYWCPKCQEQFVDGLEIKSNYTKYYNKKDWN
jgi:hypothetical protein